MEITVPFSSYKYLRFFAVLGGLLGVAQSLAWLGMAITAILAYNCTIDFTGTAANFGTILRLTIFHMYFRGDCAVTGFPVVDFTALSQINLMTPQTVVIWMWVVVGLSLLWLFSSVTLITNVKKSNIRHLNTFLYIWIFITLAITIIDLVIFILFIIDYHAVMQRAFTISLNFAPSTQAILITAQNTAGMMASLALRGYILWFINLCITVYLFTQTFKVNDYNTLSGANRSGQANPAFKSEEIQGHSVFKNQPISAYETQTTLDKTNTPWYNYLTTDIPRVQRPQSVYPQPLSRSKSTSNLDESFQQRMTAAAPTTNGVVLRQNNRQTGIYNQPVMAQNYTQSPAPQIYESRPPLKSALRNSRYQ